MPWLFSEFRLGVIPSSLKPLHKGADAHDCVSACFWSKVTCIHLQVLRVFFHFRDVTVMRKITVVDAVNKVIQAKSSPAVLKHMCRGTTHFHFCFWRGNGSWLTTLAHLVNFCTDLLVLPILPSDSKGIMCHFIVTTLWKSSSSTDALLFFLFLPPPRISPIFTWSFLSSW